MQKTILSLFLFLTSTSIASSEHPISFGLHVGYSPSYLLMLDTSGTEGGTRYSQSYLMEYEKGAEYGLTLWRMPKNGWGFQLAGDIGPVRKMEKITSNGTTYTVQPGDRVPTFQTHFIRFGTAYRWDTFYIPLGLAYGITRMTIPTSGTLEVNNGVGIYAGIGWNFGDTVAIEYISRSATTGYSFKSGADNETGIGAVGSALLNLKILF